jgi:hypothetical protein
MESVMTRADGRKKQGKRRAGAIEEVVDRGARDVEEIHRSISDLPFTVMRRLGVMEETLKEVKRIHDTSVGAIYETIRDVNHKVAKLADDLIEEGRAPAPKESEKHSAAA